MARRLGESASRHPRGLSCSGNSSSSDAGDFQCNICFELAQDPIVTLCGHLFCWPCLYKWLCLRAHSPECPVCKAVVQEDKLVPLYGRGKASTDPRTKLVPGGDIPPRPAGMRPQTAPTQNPNNFPWFARVGNLGLAAGFTGRFPSLFGVHVQGFPDPSAYGASAGFPIVFGSPFHGRYANVIPPYTTIIPRENSLLTILFLFVGIFIIFAILFA